MESRRADLEEAEYNDDPNLYNNHDMILEVVSDYFRLFRTTVQVCQDSIAWLLSTNRPAVHSTSRAEFELASVEIEETVVVDESPKANPLQEALNAAGFTTQEIKDHPKLGVFFDPVTHEIMQSIAITDTNEMVDKDTAIRLVKANLRLTKKNPIQFFCEAPLPVNQLIKLLVQEAIAEKLAQAKLSETSHTLR